jgi:ATP-dependent DNA helicase RecG
VNPLQALVGPLRYATQRDFALLGTVRDLRGVVRGALEAARAQKLSADWEPALRRELDEVDSPHPERRKASVLRLLRVLHAAGVPLPPELSALVGEPVAGAGEGTPIPVRVAGEDLRQGSLLELAATGQAPAGAPVPPAPEPGPEADDPEQEPAAPAPAPSGRGGASRKAGAAPRAEKRPLPAPDLRAEARLLSIAPRAGPLATPLRSVGWKLNPRLLAALNRKGLRKVGDVLFLLPRCYEDRRRIRKVAELVPGERGVTVGVVQRAGDSFVRGGRRKMFRAVLADETGSVSATYFQSGPWLRARFPIGRRLVVSGELRATPAGREIVHPEIEPADDLEGSPIHFNRIVPIYPGFERHEQRAFRELAFKIAEGYAHHLDEPLPAPLREKLLLWGLPEALKRIHFPEDGDDLELLDKHMSPAHRRLAFDELFFLQLGMALKRQGVKVIPGIRFNVGESRLRQAAALLPFQLTPAQARVVKQIARDMEKPEPMNRLLQGDVGSGKTAVALVTCALALQDGYQVGVMAPTEILAEQLSRNFARWLEPMGFRAGLVSAGGGAKKKREVRERLASGELHCAVGTHALIQEGVEFLRLGLVVIDEQHRFGVIQRHALMSKGRRPDVLVMTATPIPRTLAMTLYGDLEVSFIDELPPGRTPITTRVFSDRARGKVYEAMHRELRNGHQAYVVYPLVEESEKLDLADATRGAESLKAIFEGYEVGLLHGRMKQEEKEAVMGAFREGRIHVLVCTTVVEVGVDVPNASVMVIEAAERFGLSQLHQLRGRVGRGAAQSHCYLVAGFARSKESSDRLRVMEESTNGFVIAERDLEIRGPGEFLGTRQSGIPELAVANLARDAALLATAREEARAIVDADPGLGRPEHQPLVRALEERWEGRLSLARVG